ncbi:MAG: GC-type dockerin domain-anchored protein [Planctomycetota bacterium]
MPHSRAVLASAGFTLIACAAAQGQNVVSFDLSGDDADGYLATVNLNQEGNQTLAGISRDPMDPKFFDYPAFINPDLPTNIWIMYVEPYKFGLTYPAELYPNAAGDLVSVGTIRPAADASLPGVTFIDGVTEDADFSIFNVGSIEFDADPVATVGIDTVAPADLTITFDGTEFESVNRTEILPGADLPPFLPSGRSNRNEAANVVLITQLDTSGTGLTFTDGVLTDIDLIINIEVEAVGAAFPPGFGLTVPGTLTIAGDQLAFDADGLDSTPFATDVRLILNRRGTIDAVGSFSVGGSVCLADVNGNGVADPGDFNAWILAFNTQGPGCDQNGNGLCEPGDFNAWILNFNAGCP